MEEKIKAKIMDEKKMKRTFQRLAIEILERQPRGGKPGVDRHPDPGRVRGPPHPAADQGTGKHRYSPGHPRHHHVPRRPAQARAAAGGQENPDRFQHRRPGHHPDRRRGLHRPHHPRRHGLDLRTGPAGHRSSWWSSSTAATAKCPSAPTSRASTCPPRAARRVKVMLKEIDGKDQVLIMEPKGF